MRLLPLLALLFLPVTALAEIRTEKGVSYLTPEAASAADDYQRELSTLDIRHPADGKNLPTLVWFHGGGLTGGKRSFPGIQDPGIILVAASYRLSPRAPLPAFIEDAAAATAWTLKNISRYGGDPTKVFVGGHSAGGYLAAMLGMDAEWLKPHGFSPTDLAGLIPVSAQATTHFHVKELLGDKGPALRPLIDRFAPLYHSSKDLPPICLILGDRAIEFKSRVEENLLLSITLRNLGHPHVEFHEMGGLDHNTVAGGADLIIPGFIQRVLPSEAP
jgi:acetyl esterase/lipase